MAAIEIAAKVLRQCGFSLKNSSRTTSSQYWRFESDRILRVSDHPAGDNSPPVDVDLLLRKVSENRDSVRRKTYEAIGRYMQERNTNCIPKLKKR
jgi:hypothetical protein